MTTIKRLTPDQLFRELVEHVGETLKAASAGDYQSREWLCQTFDSYTNFFHEQWIGARNERTTNGRATAENGKRGSREIAARAGGAE